MRFSFSFLLIFLLLSPYVLLTILSPTLDIQWSLDFLTPLARGVYQALLSSFLALILGGIFSLSLFALSGSKKLFWAETALLAPNFIPPLFIVLSVLSLCQALQLSHQGLHWVVITHGLMNAGMFAVAIYRFVGLRAVGPIDAARIYGASKLKILRSVVLPILIQPLSYTFVFVFGLCLVSFSVPLILGGPGTTSLEIHIFRQIRNGSFGTAMVFSFIQSFLILLVSGVILRTRLETQEEVLSRYWSWPKALGLLSFIPIVLLCGFWLFDLTRILFLPWSLGSWQIPLLHSLILSLYVFLILNLLSFLVLAQRPYGILFEFLKGYISPSLAVIAFSLLLVPGDGEQAQMVKAAIAFSLLVFPVLFRWMLLSEWKALESQIQIAQVFGASRFKIAIEVLWGQLLGPVLKMALMGMVWMIGDFGVSSFFFNGDRTLALKVTAHLNSYELESAYIFSFIIFATSLILFAGGRKVIQHVEH